MAKVYGHRKCRSVVEVVTKDAFDGHAHGIITRGGKVKNVNEPMMLATNEAGEIVATKELNADIEINGTVTATKVVGAVYM